MTRPAKLYFLYTNWNLLIQAIENFAGADLRDSITIFDSYLERSVFETIVVSTHADADKLIEEHSGVEANAEDFIRNRIHTNTPQVLYGNKDILVYLEKI